MNARPFMLFCLLVGMPACRVTDLPFWTRANTKTDLCEVRRVKDVAYYDGPETNARRHRIDLFLPTGKTDFPVVVLVHGGAWMVGDNRCCGLYSAVGEYLASQGIGAVLPNYRLSPSVKHPEHIKDLARAFAWTRRTIKQYGGDPTQLFLVGHSAGGHLVALLATDEQYLKAEGCLATDIRGVIGISGVYHIPAGQAEVELGGTSKRSLTLAEMAPLRGESSPRDPIAMPRSGVPFSVNIFAPAFGNDPQARRAASPVHHVRRGLPPFLLINAEHDLPLLPEMAKEMDEQLRKHGCSSRHATIAKRNHNSVLFKAIASDDPVGAMIIQFVHQIPSLKRERR
ncbi:MAG: alpha/beta hydrolase [Planctomycetes bacterium]|nr:alpha/beta hydrolase [Planctomycetota bacterium]